MVNLKFKNLLVLSIVLIVLSLFIIDCEGKGGGRGSSGGRSSSSRGSSSRGSSSHSYSSHSSPSYSSSSHSSPSYSSSSHSSPSYSSSSHSSPSHSSSNHYGSSSSSTGGGWRPSGTSGSHGSSGTHGLSATHTVSQPIGWKVGPKTSSGGSVGHSPSAPVNTGYVQRPSAPAAPPSYSSVAGHAPPAYGSSVSQHAPPPAYTPYAVGTGVGVGVGVGAGTAAHHYQTSGANYPRQPAYNPSAPGAAVSSHPYQTGTTYPGANYPRQTGYTTNHNTGYPPSYSAGFGATNTHYTPHVTNNYYQSSYQTPYIQSASPRVTYHFSAFHDPFYSPWSAYHYYPYGFGGYNHHHYHHYSNNNNYNNQNQNQNQTSQTQTTPHSPEPIIYTLQQDGNGKAKNDSGEIEFKNPYLVVGFDNLILYGEFHEGGDHFLFIGQDSDGLVPKTFEEMYPMFATPTIQNGTNTKANTTGISLGGRFDDSETRVDITKVNNTGIGLGSRFDDSETRFDITKVPLAAMSTPPPLIRQSKPSSGQTASRSDTPGGLVSKDF